MATTSFLKMKCEIVPENSYRIIHSLSLPSVIEKAIYRADLNKTAGREKYGSITERRGDENKTFLCAYCDCAGIIQWENSVTAKQLNRFIRKKSIYVYSVIPATVHTDC